MKFITETENHSWGFWWDEYNSTSINLSQVAQESRVDVNATLDDEAFTYIKDLHVDWQLESEQVSTQVHNKFQPFQGT